MNKAKVVEAYRRFNTNYTGFSAGISLIVLMMYGFILGINEGGYPFPISMLIVVAVIAAVSHHGAVIRQCKNAARSVKD